jgi:hypothetical protein
MSSSGETEEKEASELENGKLLEISFSGLFFPSSVDCHRQTWSAVFEALNETRAGRGQTNNP